MTGQMCWLSSFGSEHKILHLRLQSHQPWRPYNSSPLAVPDYDVPGGSKGMATYHFLYKAGWQLLSSQEAKKLTIAPQQQDAA
jgi:hypothetical protein